MGRKIKGFVKSTKLVAVTQRETDYFSLQLLKEKEGEPKPTQFVNDTELARYRNIVEIEEYQTTYSLFGILFWSSTNIKETRIDRKLTRYKQ